MSLFSRDPQGYSASDLLHAQRLANCLAHGLAYQRLAEQARDAAVERQRSAEIEGSVELLRTISDVLDIRTVFPRVSEIVKKMLPHDALAMVFVDQDRHFVRQAHSPDDFPDPPFVTLKTPMPKEVIIADITTAPLPVFEPADAFAPVIAAGYRSFMSVRLPAREQVIELAFWSKRPGAFAPARSADWHVGSRITSRCRSRTSSSSKRNDRPPRRRHAPSGSKRGCRCSPRSSNRKLRSASWANPRNGATC